MHTQYWFHINPDLQTAHLLALSGEPGAPREVSGYAYRNFHDAIEMTAQVLDMTHGDADAVLMGQEIQGFEDAWLEVDRNCFHAVASMGEVIGAKRIEISPVACAPGQSIPVADQIAGPVLPPRLH